MHIYLPVAEMPVNAFFVLTLGCVAGTLSGLFGVGGGFLLTPLLMFYGLPARAAAAAAACQIIGSSFSGFLSRRSLGQVDLQLGTLMVLGGWIGAGVGVALFRWFQKMGQLELAISISYVVFLGGSACYMATESIKTTLRKHSKKGKIKQTDEEPEMQGESIFANWPWQVFFPVSGSKISLLLPIGLGSLSGMLVSLTGAGGGFLLIPAMIYILGMPTNVAVGTSLFQIFCVTFVSTLLQAITTHSVDIVLASLLLAGSVIGVRIGNKLGAGIPADKLRLCMAALALLTAIRLAYGLFAKPATLYTVTALT